MEWMPISSAPKDGTPVDLWDGEQRHTDYRWKATGFTGWARHEWKGGDEGYASTRVLRVSVTHWMPLPAPPTQADA